MLRTKDIFLEEQEKQIFEEKESDELTNEAIRYFEENNAIEQDLKASEDFRKAMDEAQYEEDFISNLNL